MVINVTWLEVPRYTPFTLVCQVMSLGICARVCVCDARNVTTKYLVKVVFCCCS